MDAYLLHLKNRNIIQKQRMHRPPYVVRCFCLHNKHKNETCTYNNKHQLHINIFNR